jgi:hypothetical protein
VLVLVLVLVVEIILLKQTRSLTSLHLGNAGEDSRKPLANFQSTRRSAQKKRCWKCLKCFERDEIAAHRETAPGNAASSAREASLRRFMKLSMEIRISAGHGYVLDVGEGYPSKTPRCI